MVRYAPTRGMRTRAMLTSVAMTSPTTTPPNPTTTSAPVARAMSSSMWPRPRRMKRNRRRPTTYPRTNPAAVTATTKTTVPIRPRSKA